MAAWVNRFVWVAFLLSACQEAPKVSKVTPQQIQERGQRVYQDMMRGYADSREMRDSLFLSIKTRAYKQQAFDIFEQNKHKTYFRYQPDRSDSVSVTLGNLFSKTRKHALIRWFDCNKYEYKLELYEFTDQHQRRLLYNAESWSNLDEEFISDVNGDGAQDYIIKWQNTNGCCRRDHYSIWAYNSKENRFSEMIDILNAKFFPKEKLVYGMTYGHPGQTELFKLKWKTFDTLDTLAFLNTKNTFAENKPIPYFRYYTKNNGKRTHHKLKYPPSEFKRRMPEYWHWYMGD